MRRFLFALCCAAAPAAFAQDAYDGIEQPMIPQIFDVTAFAGYQTNGDPHTNGGTLNIGDAPAFGIAADWHFYRQGSVEVMYQYTKPQAKFNSQNSLLYPSSNPFKVQSHYFQIGGMSTVPRGRLEPYLGLTVGAVLFVPETISLENGTSTPAGDTWRFAATVMGGTKVWITPNLGLRFDIRMLIPVIFTNGSFYSGSVGSGLAATGGVPSIQFAFTGGVSFGK